MLPRALQQWLVARISKGTRKVRSTYSIDSPLSVHHSWVQYHAADGELVLKQAGVFDDDGLAFSVAIDQRTKVDVTGRCDLVTNQKKIHKKDT